MLKTFSQHLELSLSELKTLLWVNLRELLNLPVVNQLLGSLDIQLLKQSLPTAKTILAKRLPPFYDWLQSELGVERVPDSPDHTTTWVIGFLNNQESLSRLVELHRPVPRIALERSIPRLLAAFDGVEDDRVRQEWQKAISALCLVLVVAARDNELCMQPA